MRAIVTDHSMRNTSPILRSGDEVDARSQFQELARLNQLFTRARERANALITERDKLAYQAHRDGASLSEIAHALDMTRAGAQNLIRRCQTRRVTEKRA